MSFQLPSVPNFNVAQPQPAASPLDQYGKMLQLKSLMGQQQMQPLQRQEAQQDIQAKTIENQQRQQELDSQQAMMKAWSDPDFLKGFTGTDRAQSSGVGFDPDALTSSLITKGVLPKDAMAMTGQFVERSQKIATTQKDIAQTGEANAAVRDKGMKILADKIGGVLDAPVGKAGDMLATLKKDLVQNPDSYAGVPKDDLAHLYSADLEHLPAMATMIGLDGKIADFHKSKAEAATAAQKLIPDGGGLSPDAKQEAAKEVAVAKATQPLKIQTAQAEAQAKQLMEGLAKPGYAFDPATNTTKLTDQTAYLQAGGKLQAFRPVTEKDVREDTMLTNRLGDVHQKLAEYRDALQKPVNENDQAQMAALLGTQGLKLGALGTEIPMDRVNAVLNRADLKNLSANGRDQLVAYKNMREAMLGYKTVLSGSARGSDKSMDLLTDALPHPAITDQDYSKRSLDAFEQNLGIVGQGLPELPGIKTPRQVVAEIATAKAAQTKKAVTPGAFDWNVMPQHQ